MAAHATNTPGKGHTQAEPQRGRSDPIRDGARPVPERLASAAFRFLAVLQAKAPDTGRAMPGTSSSSPVPDPAATADNALTPAERARSASLMRVNDAGEVAAQGLYDGQLLFARAPQTAAQLAEAAREEADHLRWCRQRLDELDARPSLFNPAWYAGAFALGGAAALLGDRISNGFLAETERQVVHHLEDHLTRLPEADSRSAAVLGSMLDDEAHHRDTAVSAGGTPLPAPLRGLMHAASRVMTHTASRG